jgi:cell wall-associated NlpC family hydrolase
MPTRDDVIRKARECIGTPFRDQGRIKGRGLDCLGIVLWICAELKIRDASGAPIRVEEYGDWGGSPVGDFMLRECERRLYEKPIDPLETADVLVMAVSSDPTHLAIVTSLKGSAAIIHAYGGAIQKVSEHRLDLKWRRRIRGVFTLPGVEG